MAVGFASYEIARSGLFVNERGLYVTGHNISNVNTPGYVRQQAMITDGSYQSNPNEYGMYQLGLGADIQQIRQIRHTFLDNTYRQENTTLGYWETRNKTFQDIQAILGEPMGSGLQGVMNQFWNSWQELSKEPDSLTARALVRQNGEAFVQKVNHVGTQLDKLQDDLNSEIQVRIDEVNQITEQIRKMNISILKTEVSGDGANDYRDQRNSLIDRLTKLVSADVVEMQDGQLDITLGGYFIVSKGESTKLYAGERSPGEIFNVPKIAGTNIEVSIKSGIIKGLMESRGEVAGVKGSIGNGTPNTKADIAFAVDISNTSASYLANVKSSIANYVDELKRAGIDYNLRLITFGNNVISNNNYGKDEISLANAIPALPTADAGNNFGGAAGVIEALEGISNYTSTNRYALVFTGESIEGNGGTAITDAIGYINRLNNLGVKASVVTDNAYFNAGNPGAEVGWSAVTSGTGGILYDINTAAGNYTGLMTSIGSDVRYDMNREVGVVPESNNIISDLRRRLNGLVNIMTREVNYLHSGGKTYDNKPGSDFFTAIDSQYPIEMGNIKLNDNLQDLNRITASLSGANGDNTNALNIANLRNVPALADAAGDLSIDDYYQSIILIVGYNGSDAQRISENQSKLVQSADSSRQAIMGVSMDEEMTNMMKYKFAYDASARTLNVIDEMIDTIISKMGLVGR